MKIFHVTASAVAILSEGFKPINNDVEGVWFSAVEPASITEQEVTGCGDIAGVVNVLVVDVDPSLIEPYRYLHST